MPAPIRVGIRDLVGASKSYIEAQVKKANLNGNAYLTQEEAKKLPADLRDNYENFRKAGHARVTVKQFTESFTAYVTKSAKAADKNGDGVLTKTDARSLPKDLRDNFLNYVTATQAPTPTAPVSETDKGRAALKSYIDNVIFNTGNPEGDSFRSNILDGQSPAVVADIRNQLNAAAATWSPTGPDWEKFDEGSGNVTYAGRFFQLYTEVRFKTGQQMPEVYVEID
jgi:hypothetical protein